MFPSVKEERRKKSKKTERKDKQNHNEDGNVDKDKMNYDHNDVRYRRK
jgi:hypothetical protein